MAKYDSYVYYTCGPNGFNQTKQPRFCSHADLSIYPRHGYGCFRTPHNPTQFNPGPVVADRLPISPRKLRTLEVCG